MSLLNNPKKVRRAVAVVMLLLVIALFASTSTCHAAEMEFDLGYGRTIVRGPTDVAAATVVWPKQIGNIDLYAGAILIGDYDYGSSHQGNQIVVRAGVTPHIGNLGVSLGVAAIQHDDLLNSGRINFNLGFSYTIGKNWILNIGHISNAGSFFPNTGRDFIVLYRRFR